MNNFQKEYPNAAKALKQKFPEKAPLSSLWHWVVLVLFSFLTITSIQNQLWTIGGLILLTALVKGPGLLIWGIVYSFLVSLFPPLGIVLSAIFFLLNIRLLTRSWRVNLITTLFYFYPLGISILQHFTDWTATWQTALLLLPGLILLHFGLIKVYTYHPNARQVAWTVLATPFELMSLLLPKRFKNHFNGPDYRKKPTIHKTNRF
ncbi:hypothetical protein [Enterococcus sp. AZ109]|uniref:hypothetical protein n=1 Tax=Enterococcus sp. AZ109 TaxID=2774634 RepID=UPI003F2654D6